MKIRSTMPEKDLKICKYWLSLPSEEFSDKFDLLSENEQKHLQSILETYRLDILDTALDLKMKL